MIKLIVTDMDGTLLNNQSQLPPSFEETYRHLKDKGIQFAIASGRPYENLKALFKHIQHDIIFISDNGAYIGIEKPVIMSSFYTTDIQEIIEWGRKYSDINFLVCGINNTYIESNDKDFIHTLNHHQIPFTVVNDILQIDDKILKITACHKLSWNSENTHPFSKVNDALTVTASAKQWMDIMGKANKGEAVRYLQKHLSVLPNETMVFGDYKNDLEMLQTTPYSYAMQNAHPEVKKIANYEAPDNNQYGVIKVIEETIINGSIITDQ